MGFYAPAQLVRCATEHGVKVRPVDINHCCWDSTLERDASEGPVLRLGLRLVKGLSEDTVRRVVTARRKHCFRSVQDLVERVGLNKKDLDALAGSGALSCLVNNRHLAHWDAAGVQEPTPLFSEIRIPEGIPMLKPPTEGQELISDYRHLGLSLGRHPLALLRGRFVSLGLERASQVVELPHGTCVQAVGLVVTRQRPSSAAGVTFVTIEDETGYLNLVVWERLAERQRSVLLGATLLGVSGQVQKEGGVVHIVAGRLYDYSTLLGELPTQSRDFH